MIKLVRETQMTIDRHDMATILTDGLCGYNALAGLQATIVNQNKDGDFEIILTPKPEDEAQ